MPTYTFTYCQQDYIADTDEVMPWPVGFKFMHDGKLTLLRVTGNNRPPKRVFDDSECRIVYDAKPCKVAPNVPKPNLVTFMVSVYSTENLEYIREGIYKLYHNVRIALPKTQAKYKGGIWTLTLVVHHEKVTETFNYLYACVEMGYALVLKVEPISAPYRLEEVH